MEKDVKSIGQEQIRFAYKNQAFNALMFVFSCLVQLFRQIDGEARAKMLMDLFKPLYDNLSKEFVTDFSRITFYDKCNEGHESKNKSAYKG